MDVYLAMDLMGGKVVAGAGGRREQYREVSLFSKVASSSHPVEVVGELRPRNVYIADLDRIEGRGDNFAAIFDVCEKVDAAIVDAGFRNFGEIQNYPFIPVLGTETFDVTALKDGEYVVSVDIKEKLLDRSGRFTSHTDLLEYLNSFRLRAVLILPIHSVGTLSFDFSIVEEAIRISDHRILTGGGMKDMSDLERAKEMGVDGVIVSTAIHTGRIDAEVLRRGRI